MTEKKLKVIKHDGWKETIWPSGFVMREGNYPEYMEHEFYAQYKHGAARIHHRGTFDQLFALADKRLAQEEI
jgi:hypothetical protein